MRLQQDSFFPSTSFPPPSITSHLLPASLLSGPLPNLLSIFPRSSPFSSVLHPFSLLLPFFPFSPPGPSPSLLLVHKLQLVTMQDAGSSLKGSWAFTGISQSELLCELCFLCPHLPGTIHPSLTHSPPWGIPDSDPSPVLREVASPLHHPHRFQAAGE